MRTTDVKARQAESRSLPRDPGFRVRGNVKKKCRVSKTNICISYKNKLNLRRLLIKNKPFGR